jgi:prolyl 4-hydroxylase
MTKEQIIENEIPNFITKEECQAIIELGNSIPLVKGRVSGEGTTEGYRNALTETLPRTDLVESIRMRVGKLLNMDYLNSEGVVFIKYELGGVFYEHSDFFQHHSPEMAMLISQGMNRIKTAIIYLNDDFEGGITQFPHIGVEVKPETGKLVSWNNGTEYGQWYSESNHLSTIITKGTKYIITFWMHQGRMESARPEDTVIAASSRNSSKKYE